MQRTSTENILMEEREEVSPPPRRTPVPSRAERIRAILDQRKPYLVAAQSQRAQIAELLSSLKSLKEHLPDVVSAAKDPAKQDGEALFAGLKEIPLDELITRSAEQLKTIDKLISRFGRETLNIATVGNARQGKSRLLRSLSGLGSDVVPDRPGPPCTGVRSTIVHQTEGETRGEVIYHTPETLLEIILQYWRTIEFAQPAPSSVAAFLNARLPEVPSNGDANALKTQLYKELAKYHSKLKSLIPRLGTKEEIPKQHITRYVTQPEGEADAPEAYIYLVVREVKIYCRFPHDDVGGVGLIDLPGLGEATLGGPERVVKTLELDADVALFAWKPNKNEAYISEDFLQLYDTSSTALHGHLPLRRWAYLVINHWTTRDFDNTLDSERAKRNVSKSPMEYFGLEICDCSDDAQVKARVLEPVLNYMAENIATLDRDFASSAMETTRQLHEDVSRALLRARAELDVTDDRLEGRRFNTCFEGLWEELTKMLNELVLKLEVDSEKPDEQFKNLVEGVIGEFERSSELPTEEEIESKLLSKLDPATVYGLYRHEIRAALSDRLRGLDGGLDQSMSDVKKSVAQVFLKAGRFEQLTGDGQDLDRVPTVIPPDFTEIHNAFRNLEQFQLSARGLLGFKVRKALNFLEPIRSDPPKADETDAARLARDLQGLVRLVVNTIRDAFVQEEYRRPRESAYAAVADFRDAVAFARGMQDEWRLFYQSVKAQIWPEVFKRMVDIRRRREDLLELIDQAEKANRGDRREFIS